MGDTQASSKCKSKVTSGIFSNRSDGNQLRYNINRGSSETNPPANTYYKLDGPNHKISN